MIPPGLLLHSRFIIGLLTQLWTPATKLSNESHNAAKPLYACSYAEVYFIIEPYMVLGGMFFFCGKFGQVIQSIHHLCLKTKGELWTEWAVGLCDPITIWHLNWKKLACFVQRRRGSSINQSINQTSSFCIIQGSKRAPAVTQKWRFQCNISVIIFFFYFDTQDVTHGPMINHYIQSDREKRLLDAAVIEDASGKRWQPKAHRQKQVNCTDNTITRHVIPFFCASIKFPHPSTEWLARIFLRFLPTGAERHRIRPNVGQLSYRALFSTKYSWTEVGW